MSKKYLIIVFIILSNLLLYINTYAENKMPVEVKYTGDDVIGNRLVYQVKENIRRSNAMKLSSIKEPRYIIFILSLDEFKDSPGVSSVYSIVWLQCIMIKGIQRWQFVDHSVGICGSKKVNDVAEHIVARTDNNISEDLKQSIDPISTTNLENTLQKQNKLLMEQIKNLLIEKNK